MGRGAGTLSLMTSSSVHVPASCLILCGSGFLCFPLTSSPTSLILLVPFELSALLGFSLGDMGQPHPRAPEAEAADKPT